jgi:hypothetical protein
MIFLSISVIVLFSVALKDFPGDDFLSITPEFIWLKELVHSTQIVFLMVCITWGL